MDTDKVRQRFDRIEGYIDYVYDVAYGAIDGIFYGVDHVFDHIKKRALAHAERVSGSPQTPVEKAYALADYYENNGKPARAKAIRSYADKGFVDVDMVNRAWDGIQPPGKEGK